MFLHTLETYSHGDFAGLPGLPGLPVAWQALEAHRLEARVQEAGCWLLKARRERTSPAGW